jgi:uncharacterized membrane protein HdeD (DUF308 family)
MNSEIISGNSSNNIQQPFLSIPLFKGVIIIIWGILALLLAQSQQMLLVRSFGILNFVTFLITLIFMLHYKHLAISDQWVKLEALVELTAGIIFTFMVDNISDFMYYISIGIIFIIILQFIYGYLLLNTGKYNMTNIVMRFLTLIAGVVISISIFANVISPSAAFVIIGLFSLLYGIINIHFGMSLQNAFLGHAK